MSGHQPGWQPGPYDPGQHQRHGQRPMPQQPPQGWQQHPPQQPQGNWAPPPPAFPQQYPPPWMPQERHDEVTIQSGSNAFHITMCILTGGLWLLAWPFFRRKAHVKTRTTYR